MLLRKPWRRRSFWSAGRLGVPSRIQPCSSAVSWQSGQTSTYSRPSGVNRTDRSPRRSDRSQIAQVRPRVLVRATGGGIYAKSGFSESFPTASNLDLFLLLLGRLDQLLGDVRRHLVVAEEVRVVVAAAAGERGQRLRVRQELGHRHLGLDGRHPTPGLHPEEAAAARVQVAVDGADGLVRNGHLDLHDRLEQDRVGLLVRALERHRAGDLERHLRRVDGVVRAVDEQDADALDGRAGELAVEHRLLDSLVDRRTEALRDDAADDLVDELVPGVARDRLEDDVAVAVLASAARLLLVLALRARLLADRLEVRHPLLAELDVDAEPALQTLDGDLDMHLAHAGDELLARLLVAPERQRRILLGEPAERRRHLLLVPLRLRRDREAHHGLRERDRRELDRTLR